GKDVSFTLMQFPDLSALQERLDPSHERQLTDTLHLYLNASSSGGDCAGKIATDKYSFIHQSNLDVENLSRQLEEITSNFDPLGEGLSVESKTIEFADRGISDEDIAQGLLYTLRQFRDSAGADFTLGNLSNKFSDLMAGVIDSVKSFKDNVAKGDFFAVFQPIVDVNSGEIHHFEALARFNKLDHQQSPYEYIAFAEETGLIWEFDIAMLKKVLAWAVLPENRKHSVAVNVSGYSIGNADYGAQLETLLRQNHGHVVG
ncbi:MAG: EAL domain-containing protein, partial [Alphaproteobacteria bacterium]|nr:EAL domain-containing protein [Alphaproteobacteria bacterium]